MWFWREGEEVDDGVCVDLLHRLLSDVYVSWQLVDVSWQLVDVVVLLHWH